MTETDTPADEAQPQTHGVSAPDHGPVVPEPVPVPMADSEPIASEETPGAEDSGTQGITRDDVEGIKESINGMVSAFERLQRDFESKIKYDMSKERTIDALHKELQSYREGMHFKILQPIFLDLIQVYDDLCAITEPVAPADTMSDTEAGLCRNLESFRYSIEDMLERYGVTIYEQSEETLVPRRQRPVKVVNTDLPEYNGRIVERIRKGFEFEDKVLRPEIVAVFKYVKPEMTETETEAE